MLSGHTLVFKVVEASLVIDMLVVVCVVAVHCKKDSIMNIFAYTLVTVWIDNAWL
jgi:hypothetical protein